MVPTPASSALPASAYRTIAVITLTIFAVAVSYGAISGAAGFPVWQTLMLAVFALGGAAELTFVGVVAAGGAPVLAVLAGLLVNTRNLPFGLTVGAWIPQDGRSLLAAHLVNDETVAFSRAQSTERARWRGFLIMGVAIFICWPIGAATGQLLGRIVDADAFGVDAAFPVILLALITSDLRHRITGPAALLGMAIAFALTPLLPLGLGPVSGLLALVPFGIWAALRSRGGGRQ